ncbi:MAG: sensor domain-containing diguanylate cyclase [Acidobacteriota bacterium]
MSDLIAIWESLEGHPWFPWAVVGAATLLLIWVLRNSSNNRKAAASKAPPAHSFRSENEYRELHKSMLRVQKENESLSNFFILLPEFTKELNSPMQRRDIAPLLIQVLDRIFGPQQILILFMDKKENKLILHAQKGLGEETGRNFHLPVGMGRIGWVAKHQTAMNVDDFINLMRTTSEKVDSSAHFQFKTDLAVPILHEEETLGVISLGGISHHPKYEKRIAKMIADLGSIALYNDQLFRELQYAANSDGLTKLFNKKFFLYLLGNEIHKCEKERSILSVLLFDLDHFKKLNDTYGHLTGDEVLRVVGRVMRETVREEDMVARYGGEEFMVLFPNTNKEGAMVAADKIRKVLEAEQITGEKGQVLKPVTLSGGVSSFPEDGTASTELIQAADEALYRAKHGGRNRILPAQAKYLSNESPELNVSDLTG